MDEASVAEPAWHTVWADCWGTPPPKPSSREESIAAALDRLMTGLPTVGYNHRFKPAGPAAIGFNELRRRAFGDVETGDPIEVISEGTWPLPSHLITGKRKGCSPDWVIVWANTILIVEFKTEKGSMGRRQVEEQLAVMRYHHPATPLLHLYVTPMPASFQPHLEEGMSYRNTNWEEFVAPLVAPFGAEPDAVALSRYVALAEAASWWQ